MVNGRYWNHALGDVVGRLTGDRFPEKLTAREQHSLLDTYFPTPNSRNRYT